MTTEISIGEVIVRLADFSDMEGLLNLGKAFHAYADLEKFGLGFNRKRFSGVLVHFMSDDNFCIFVAEIDNQIIGSVAGMVAPWFLDPLQFNASENWWFVLPEYRGSIGIDLMDQFELWAKSRGAKCIAVAGFAEKRLPALTRLYRQKGFKPLEMHFVKEL